MPHSIIPKIVSFLAFVHHATSFPYPQPEDVQPTAILVDAPTSSLIPSSSSLDLSADSSSPSTSPTTHPLIPRQMVDNGRQYGPMIVFAVMGCLFAFVILYALLQNLYDWYYRPRRPDSTSADEEDEDDTEIIDVEQLRRDLRLYTTDSVIWSNYTNRVRTARGRPAVNRVACEDGAPPPPYGAGECVPSYEESQMYHHGHSRRVLGYVPVVAVEVEVEVDYVVVSENLPLMGGSARMSRSSSVISDGYCAPSSP